MTKNASGIIWTGKLLGGALVLTLTCLVTGAFAADHYWVYSYKDFDVTSSNGAENAELIAHNLDRLDKTITAVLGVRAATWRPPTYVYSVPRAAFRELIGNDTDAASLFAVQPFRNI